MRLDSLGMRFRTVIEIIGYRSNREWLVATTSKAWVRDFSLCLALPVRSLEKAKTEKYALDWLPVAHYSRISSGQRCSSFLLAKEVTVALISTDIHCWSMLCWSMRIAIDTDRTGTIADKNIAEKDDKPMFDPRTEHLTKQNRRTTEWSTVFNREVVYIVDADTRHFDAYPQDQRMQSYRTSQFASDLHSHATPRSRPDGLLHTHEKTKNGKSTMKNRSPRWRFFVVYFMLSENSFWWQEVDNVLRELLPCRVLNQQSKIFEWKKQDERRAQKFFLSVWLYSTRWSSISSTYSIAESVSVSSHGSGI